MSLDLLKIAVLNELQKEADETATRMLNVSISQSVEQIALNIASLRGMALALGRAVEIVETEYKLIVAPEKAAEEKKQKTREIY